MGDKKRGGRSKMHVTRIDDPMWWGAEAKRFARELLHHEHRGPGDTIEAAAARIERKHGVDASVVLQGWQRPPREMKVSRWMALYLAHWEAIASKAYEDRRHDAADRAHPALLWLADTVAGRAGAQEGQESERE